MKWTALGIIVLILCKYVCMHTVLKVGGGSVLYCNLCSSLFETEPGNCVTYYYTSTVPSVSTQTCPVFGTDLTERRHPTRAGLFLNFENPAQCNGTAKAWHYCYYGKAITDPSVFAADFVVYRKTSLNSNEYERVALKSVVKSQDDLQSTGFHCETVTLEQSEYFEVQEDDIIGACLIEEGTQTLLNILSHQVLGHGEVYRPNQNTELCDPFVFETVDFGNMFEQGRHVVHLYINIGKEFISFCHLTKQDVDLHPPEAHDVTSPSGAAPSPSTAETQVISTSMTMGQLSSNHNGNDLYVCGWKGVGGGGVGGE